MTTEAAHNLQLQINALNTLRLDNKMLTREVEERGARIAMLEEDLRLAHDIINDLHPELPFDDGDPSVPHKGHIDE